MALGENIKLLNIPSIQKDDKIYGTIPQGNTSDYVCSRNGSATYFDKDGVIRIAEPNQPRLDFDPATGEFKGVLVEEEGTNFVIQNNPNNIPSVGYDFEEFQDEIYGTAYKVFEPLGYSGNHSFYNTNTNGVLFNNIRARYIIAKSGSGGRFLQVSSRSNGWLGVLFNLETQTFTGIKGSGLFEPFIIPLKNGWAIYGFIDYVLNNTFPVNAGYSISFTSNLSAGSSSTIYTNDGSFIYVLPYPMAYIGEQFIMPIITNGSQVTRPADIITIPNYSTLFGNRNSRLISVNNQNKIILNDEINQLPVGHNKLMFEKDDFLTIEEQESLSATTVSYGVREDIKDEFNEILSLNPSLVLIPGKSSVGELQTLLPNDGTGDFSVSRNGTATYLGKDGLLKTAQANEPRLEFNPDGSFKGVLIEPSATNLLLRSEEFENSYWFKTGVTVETSIESPFIGVNSRLIRLTNEISLHNINVFTQSQNTFTVSFFAKYGNGIENIQIRNSAFTHTYSLITGLRNFSLGINQNGLLSNIEQYPNGWWRITGTAEVGTNNATSVIFIDDSGNTNFEGNSENFIYLFGMQKEVGSVATSYIPTVASTVTRPADLIQKTNAQDLIGQSEGSVYFESYVVSNSLNARIYIALNLNVSDIFGIGIKDNKLTLVYRNNSGTLSTNTLGEVLQIGDKLKCCFIYTSNSLKVFVNGSLYSNTTTLLPSLSSISLTGDRLFYGTVKQHLKSATIFKTPLTDEQAIALTTL